MFPRNASIAAAAKAQEIRDYAVWLDENPRCSSQVGTDIRDRLDQLLADSDQFTQGRRLDAWLKAPDGQEIFIDATGSHATAATYRNRTVRHCATARMSKLEALANNTPDPLVRAPTPHIAAAVARKEDVYGPMMHLAGKYRAKKPFLFILAFSRLGELSSHVFQLADWICKEFVKNVASGSSSPDGASVAVQRCRFRAEFLTEISCAIATGTGRILKEAGFPNRSW